MNDIQNQQTITSAKNAIPISKEFLNRLKSALSKNANPIDKLPSDRVIVDLVVQQMSQSVGAYVYYRGKEDSNTYLWFDSDAAKSIQSNPEIKDKRRYVEALIGSYLGGQRWLQQWCVASREIRPRIMEEEEVIGIRNTAAAIADAKSVDSNFQPGSDRSGDSTSSN